jgi:hypothetical protein
MKMCDLDLHLELLAENIDIWYMNLGKTKRVSYVLEQITILNQ